MVLCSGIILKKTTCKMSVYSQFVERNRYIERIFVSQFLHPIAFCCFLLYSTSMYFVLSHHILSYSIPFCSIQIYSISLYSIIFYFILFYSILVYSTLLYCTSLYFILVYIFYFISIFKNLLLWWRGSRKSHTG